MVKKAKYRLGYYFNEDKNAHNLPDKWYFIVAILSIVTQNVLTCL